jgi:hypothetical protein
MINYYYELLLLFQRWSTEVPWLIADASGLIVDLARMVQGSSYHHISVRSSVCIGYAAQSTRELVALLLSAGAEQGMSSV